LTDTFFSQRLFSFRFFFLPPRSERGNRICLSCSQTYNAVIPAQYPLLPLFASSTNAAPIRPPDLFDNAAINSPAAAHRRPSVSLVAAAAANASVATAAAAVARAAIISEILKPAAAAAATSTTSNTNTNTNNTVYTSNGNMSSGPSARVVAMARPPLLSRSGTVIAIPAAVTAGMKRSSSLLSMSNSNALAVSIGGGAADSETSETGTQPTANGKPILTMQQQVDEAEQRLKTAVSTGQTSDVVRAITTTRVPPLRAMLRARNLSNKGKKVELQVRLISHQLGGESRIPPDLLEGVRALERKRNESKPVPSAPPQAQKAPAQYHTPAQQHMAQMQQQQQQQQQQLQQQLQMQQMHAQMLFQQQQMQQQQQHRQYYQQHYMQQQQQHQQQLAQQQQQQHPQQQMQAQPHQMAYQYQQQQALYQQQQQQYAYALQQQQQQQQQQMPHVTAIDAFMRGKPPH
jgi:hypothetical protein